LKRHSFSFEKCRQYRVRPQPSIYLGKLRALNELVDCGGGVRGREERLKALERLVTVEQRRDGVRGQHVLQVHVVCRGAEARAMSIAIMQEQGMDQ
jgi:hypothetical protein